MIDALQSIIFDFDGVIADSEPLHFRAFQQTLADEGIELSAAEYYTRYLGYDDEGLFQALATDRGIPMNASRMSTLLALKSTRLQGMLAGDLVLFPGAVDFIRAAAVKVPIAIASGALRQEIIEITDAASIGNLFTVIVAAGDTPKGKPSPAPYLLAFEQLQLYTGRDLNPRRCVAIEDSQWGLDSARGAGLRCIGLTNSYEANSLQGAELVATGLDMLTLPALNHLCATDPQATNPVYHA